ncbi:hypothetical protein C3L33_05451, partial [Rhododendron williamsianum]
MKFCTVQRAKDATRSPDPNRGEEKLAKSGNGQAAQAYETLTLIRKREELIRNPNPNSDTGRAKSVSRSGNADRGKGLVWSRIESEKPRGSAFGYVYPAVDYKTKIVAYLDQTPDMELQNLEFTYDYFPSFAMDDTSHRGLGFCAEAEVTPSGIGPSLQMEEKEGFDSSSSEEEMVGELDYTPDANPEVVNDFQAETSSPEKNSGFLSIGGLKLYTQDISDEENDEDDAEELSDEESLETSASEESIETSDSDSEDTSESDSDIDEEVAKDYFEGIGGTDKVVDVEQFVAQRLDVSDDDKNTFGGSFNETLKKLGGIALQDASREYGMKKPQSRRKYHGETSRCKTTAHDLSSVMEDIMFVKDPRTISGRKKHVARFPQSWPSEAQKSKNFRNFPETSQRNDCFEAAERMIGRGVDLEQISSTLQQMVSGGVDMLSFQPMHSRDCSQLIGAGDEDADFTVNNVQSIREIETELEKLLRELNKRSGKPVSYAAQPVSFVSSGILLSDTLEINAIDSKETNDISPENKVGASSSKYGAFEMHTTGFGSKMMAKMGFTEDESKRFGRNDPIEAIRRPKSLGLGAESSGTSTNSSKTAPKKFRMGLGRDSQGIVDPLAAVRLPKSRGLGAKGDELISRSSLSVIDFV